MTDSPFRQKTVVVLVVTAGISLLVGLLMIVLGPELADVRSAGSDAFSSSALGHAALVELLQELEVPVVVSRSRSAEKAGDTAQLVIAEPRLSQQGGSTLARMVQRAEHVLLVLPKRFGQPARDNPRWIGQVELFDTGVAEKVLHGLDIEATVLRPGTVSRWRSRFDIRPELRNTQLMRSPSITPVISCSKGVLLGRIEPPPPKTRTFYVLSDPDLFATHGLGHARNAELSVALLNFVRKDRPLIFDEVIHGHETSPTVWRRLVEFPLALVLLQGGVLAALLLWRGLSRFGAPLRPESPHERGKETLIRNTADLFRFSGHTPEALSRYFEDVLADVAARFHVRPSEEGDEVTVLERRTRQRTTTEDLSSLKRRVDRAAEDGSRRLIIRTAMAIRRWKEEVLHGVDRDS